MLKNSPTHDTLLAYLRHELCTPINGMIGYSELLLEELQRQQPKSQLSPTLFEDLQKIRGCSQQLLTLVAVILDRDQLEMSQIDGDLGGFGSTLRMELLTPLSTIIGYCEMLLEEAPADIISDIDKLNSSAQQLLSLINDIVHLAQQQLHIITAQTDTAQTESASHFSLESPEAAYLAKSAADTLQVLKEKSPEKQPESGMILVVDDNPTNCDLLARQLQRQAYTVTTANNAQQALRLLKAIPYDLILLDVIMPGMSGLELLQQLKCHDAWRHIPVIMISALDEIDGAVKCIKLGAEDYLHKPFDPTLLKARIGAYLERKRLRDHEVLYLQQVERLIAAAAAVEAQNFNPNSLDDLTQYPNKLGQLARVFQRMAQEVRSRQQQLEQQLHLLQVSVNSPQANRLVAEIVATDHFKQLQKRTTGSLDIDNLYRPSLYPPLSGFAANEEQPETLEYQGSFQAVDRQEPAAVTTDTEGVNSSKIVAVHSFRGGTGKSNLTSNLAISMARYGKRVGIIDTDLQSPGIHVLFGVDEGAMGHTLNDYLWGDCRLHEAAHDLSHLLQQTGSTAGPISEGAIYLVPASTKPNNITRILREGYHQARLLDGFYDVIRDLELDFLLIDTHPGINEETLQAITACSLLAVVLRPDYQDYQGTSVIVELARLLSVEEILLVVNKALPTFDVDEYRQQLEAVYGVSVADILPFSEEMMHLASSEIFSIRYPDHPMAKAIDAMGRDIVDRSGESSDERGPKRRETPCPG